MIHARQHIPPFCDGFTPQTATVPTLDEILALDWVKAWTQEPNFDHWAQQTYPPHTLLLAVMKDGAQWVVAYLETTEDLGLPFWGTVQKGIK